MFRTCSISGITIFDTPNLFAQDGTPHPALWHLLKETDISINTTLHTSQLPDEIMHKTQKAWLRKPDQERWHLQQRIEQRQEAILAQLEQLGVTQPICPAASQYDAICILGAAASSMKRRIDHAIALIASGHMSASHIVILTGERSRSHDRESRYELAACCDASYPMKPNDQLPENETEIARFLLEHTRIPSQMPHIDVITAPAPSGHHRATTRDTIVSFLHMYPAMTSLVCVSHQPFICYQDTIVRSVLPTLLHTETVGPADHVADTPTAVLLDTVARWIYASVRHR